MVPTNPAFLRICLVGSATLAPAVAARAQSLYGIRWDDGVLFSISTADGSSSVIGPTGVPIPADLVLGADGFLYGFSAGQSPTLFRVDPASGSTATIGPLGIGSIFEGAMATSPAGVTYGMNSGSASAPALFQVDLATGAASGLVYLTNAPHDINGAAFRSDGALVALDRETNALLSIDPATGATSVIRVLTPILGGVSGLAVSGGVAYFATAGTGGGTPGPNELWRIDPFTGAHSRVGNLGQGGNGVGLSGLAGDGASSGAVFCFGDGSGTPCPCGNASSPAQQAGCLHSLGAGGELRAHGNPSVSADTLVLVGTSLPSAPALYFQGTATIAGGAGVAFGDGLRCVSGTIIRLGTQQSPGGTSQYPGVGDLSVSVRGLVPAGSTRHYQTWFRNAASFCMPQAFNLTNGVTINWSS